MNDWALLQIIFLLGLVVAATRALPLVFGKHLLQFKALDHLKIFLPAAIMLILTAYELQSIDNGQLAAASIALVLTLIIHYFLRNMTIGILLGTALFVGLSQLI